jgi:hypothetical protein
MATNRSRKNSKVASDNKILVYLTVLIVSAASLFFLYRQKRSDKRQSQTTSNQQSKGTLPSTAIPDSPMSVSTDPGMLAIVTPAALSYAAKDGFSTEDFQIKSALVTKGTNSAGVSVSTVTIKHKSARCEMVLEFVGQQSNPTSSNVYCK